MKQFMFFALLINFLSSCTDQNSVTEHKKEFEGKIIYLTKLESKSTKFTTDEFQSFFGDTMTLYIKNGNYRMSYSGCLLYTSDAADERSSVDLGGRRIIKKKNIK